MYSSLLEFRTKAPKVPEYRGYFRYSVNLTSRKMMKVYCEENNNDLFESLPKIPNFGETYLHDKVSGKALFSLFEQHSTGLKCIKKTFLHNKAPIAQNGIYTIEYYSTRSTVKSVIMDCDIPNCLAYFNYDKYGALILEQYIQKDKYLDNGAMLFHNMYGPAQIEYTKFNNEMVSKRVTFYKNGIQDYTGRFEALLKFTQDPKVFKPLSNRWWEDISKVDFDTFNLLHMW